MLWILMVIWYIHNTDTKCRKTKENTTHVWHCILSHWRNPHGKFHYDGFWSRLILNHLTLATFLQKSEVTKIPFTGHKERAMNLLVIIHFDVCSPINVVASSGFYLSSKNDTSRYMDIYLMRRKSGSFEIIRKVYNMK